MRVKGVRNAFLPGWTIHVRWLPRAPFLRADREAPRPFPWWITVGPVHVRFVRRWSELSWAFPTITEPVDNR